MKSQFLLILACSFQVLGWSQTAEDIAKLVRLKIDSGLTYIQDHGKPEVALGFGLEAEQYLDELKGDPHTQKELLVYLVHCLHHLNRVDLSIPRLERILRIEEQNNSKYTKLYTITLGSLGSYYFKFGHPDKSYATYLEAVNVSKNIPQQVFHLSALNNLGIYHERTGQLDSAMFYYDLALSGIRWTEREDSLLYASIRDNQASVYEKQNRTALAIEILEANMELFNLLPRTEKRIVNTALEICDQYLLLGNLKSIPQLLNLAGDHLLFKDEHLKLKLAIAIEDSWIRYARMRSDSSLLTEHQDISNLMLKEKLRLVEERATKTSGLLADYATQNIQYELDRKSQLLIMAEREAKSNLLLLILSGLFFIFLLAAIYLFYKRRVAYQKMQNLMKEKELENQKLEVGQLKTNLSHIENDFFNVLMRVSLKKNWTQEITEKLSLMINGSNHVHAEELRKLVQELKQQGNVHEKIDMYQNGIKEVNARFFDTLSDRYPDLTKHEKEVCGLIRMKLDGKEIATIRNIHPASVKKMRHRIRRKMNLDLTEDLYNVIQGL